MVSTGIHIKTTLSQPEYFMEFQMVHNGRQFSEKRESPRVSVDLLTFMNPLFSKVSIISGWIVSISCGGIGVRAKMPSSFKGIFQVGDEVELIVYEDYFKFTGGGKVMWISPAGDLAGIKFSQLRQENRKALDEILGLFLHSTFNQ